MGDAGLGRGSARALRACKEREKGVEVESSARSEHDNQRLEHAENHNRSRRKRTSSTDARERCRELVPLLAEGDQRAVAGWPESCCEGACGK